MPPAKTLVPHLTTLLTAATATRNPAAAAQLHAHLTTNNLLRHPLLHSQLINLYALTNHLPLALLLFRTVTPHHPNIVTYTTLITHLSRPHPIRALSLFSHLRAAGLRPNPFTFSAILPACSLLLPSHGPQIHALAVSHGVASDLFVGSAIVDMYAKCTNMASATKVFDEMPNTNLVTWNALIVGYVTNKLYTNAITTFRKLLLVANDTKDIISSDQVTISSVLSACANTAHGLRFGRLVHAHALKLGLESLSYVRNALIDMYSKRGCFTSAMAIFVGSEDVDVVAWNVVMMGWIQSGCHEEAVKCFWAMRRGGISPDESSYSTVLHASASLAAWCQAAAVHSQVIQSGFASNPCIGSSLVTVYAKCGTLEDAHRAFVETREQRNVVSWTAMIAAFQQHGRGDRVIRLFEDMLNEGIVPDYITFVSVLSACSHNGLIEQGFRYFNSMSRVHSMPPGNEHYACIVDMLGRAGRLDEAKQFIETMPLEPDVSVWGALLGACRNWGNMELGKEVAEKLFEMEPDNPGNYVLLWNIYNSRGKSDEAKELRRSMESSGVRKETGCSWIDVKNKTHTFSSHDRSHNRTEEIYEVLGNVEDLTKEKGYIPETSYAVNAVE